MAETDDDQKTEEATPRRRDEARQKGQVPLSSELMTGILLLGWAGALLMGGDHIAQSLGSLIAVAIEELAELGTGDLSVPQAGALLDSSARAAGASVLVLVGPLVLIGLLIGYGQVGFQIAPKAVAPDPAKLNPGKGFGRLFSARSGMRTLMAALKLVVIAGTMSAIAWTQVEEVTTLGGDLGPSLAGLISVALKCLAGALGAILALALADLLFQRFQHEKDLKMSKKEIRDEHKSTEGDPHLKARIRGVQRELARRRMMSDVPKATVVVTNPTHYAVALVYERDAEGRSSGAPRVVAKGVDHVARRIKEIAREAGVVCYEDVALARALHAQVEIGDEIPTDLYQAVASVLAYVFRIQESSGAIAAARRRRTAAAV